MKPFEAWWSKFEPQIDSDTYNGNENEVRKAIGRCTWNASRAALFGLNIPAEDRYGREPDKVKSLAQYLAKYLDHKHTEEEEYSSYFIDSYPDGSVNLDIDCLRAALQQALDAYQSTENVKIRIEPV